MDELDHDARLAQEAPSLRRQAELRIQALGAAISRRDWHAVEVAHAAIRDEFDKVPAFGPDCLRI